MLKHMEIKGGQLIDDYDPSLDFMYDSFIKYFNNPILTKIKNVNNYSVYMTKTYCLLSNECRYIVAFVPEDNMSIGTKEQLKTMRWVSIQTRTLEDDHNLAPHGYTAVEKGPLMAKIKRVKIEDTSSTYSCEDFPITVTLLNPKRGLSSYQDNGTIIAALETWETIIVLNNQ